MEPGPEGGIPEGVFLLYEDRTNSQYTGACKRIPVQDGLWTEFSLVHLNVLKLYQLNKIIIHS